VNKELLSSSHIIRYILAVFIGDFMSAYNSLSFDDNARNHRAINLGNSSFYHHQIEKAELSYEIGIAALSYSLEEKEGDA
jgi:hypothetical protein